MKTLVSFFIFIFFLTSIGGVNAQTVFYGGSGIPLKPQSPSFANDIVIHDSLTQNQRQVKICSAFNGWLYAVYTNHYSKYQCNCPGITILKSIDNGITWNIIDDIPTTQNIDTISSLDIAVGGDSISNLKLFLSCILISGSIGFPGEGDITRFDGNGNYLDGITFPNSITSLAISTDFMYPANNSNPFSIGVLYATYNTFPILADSVILLSSSNGGRSFDNYKTVATGTTHINDVSLAYGRSPSYPSGRYFAAWTQTTSFTNFTGHIFTAHSNPDFNNPFTKPVCLDSLDTSAINKMRKPIISCQFSGADNDSANLTEVVMAEKQLSLNNYDTRGFYNLQATTSNHFNEFALSSSQNNKTEPDISFNPYSSSFMLTYFDSTSHSLPFLTNDVNLTDPGIWNILTQAYNDSPDIAAPYPKVALDLGNQQGMNVWVKEGTSGNSVALFDAPTHYMDGISGNSLTDGIQLQVYPNPCNSSLNISFISNSTEMVKITLSDQLGKSIGIIANRSFSDGKNLITYDVSRLANGSYLLTFIGNNIVQTRKLFIVR
jgi:hypothetical protein